MEKSAMTYMTETGPVDEVLKPGLFRSLDNALRRLLDLTLSIVGLVLLSPIFLLIGLAIKRDSPGPTFYWGKRVGKDERPFRILKFRTMYEKTESYRGPRLTGQGDKRITPLGQWLRDTKLNELPQLWNVLKGDMSLVGPRPEDAAFVVHWPREARRLLLTVRPGITSPASVLYRDEEKLLQAGNVVDDYLRVILPSKLRLDVLYVQHRNVLTDFDVLFWTLVALLPQLKTKRVSEHLLLWGPLARFFSRYFSWFTLDFLVALLAVAITGVLWRSSGPLHVGVSESFGIALAIAVVFSLVNTLLGLGQVVWAKAGIGDALALTVSTVLTTLVLLLANSLWQPKPLLPAGLLVVVGMLALGGFVTTRYRMRIITGLSAHWISMRGKTGIMGERVLIVGAGEVGELAAYLLRKGELAQAFSIVGMVDDAPRKQGARIDGCQVLGRTANIPEVVAKHDIGLILFAIENIGAIERERILDLCYRTAAQTVIVPDVLAAFHARIPGEMRAGSPGVVVSPSLDEFDPGLLSSSLAEIDVLMEARAWDMAHAKLQALQDKVAVHTDGAQVRDEYVSV